MTALWQRRENWAFGAGLALNLAVSLWLWDAHRGEALAHWWVPLVQANVLAGSATALLWLTVRRRLEGEGTPARLLTLQLALVVLGNAALLVGPAARLVLDPEASALRIAQAGTLWGWLALLTALAATIWHVTQTVARTTVHVLCVLGLAAGVLAACTVTAWRPDLPWLGYHTLTVAWAVTGGLALAIGWLSARGEGGIAGPTVPTGLLQGWATALAALVAALGVRGIGADPAGPGWTFGVLLTAGALAGALAIWTRTQVHVYASGLLTALAGMVLWNDWTAPLELVEVIALYLGIASAFWSVVELALRGRSGLDLRRGGLPFAHAAAGVVVCSVAAVAGLGVVSGFTGAGVSPSGLLAWAALAAAVVAVAMCLRDPDARLPLAGLYVLGLSAIGLTLQTLSPMPRWLAAPLLAGYVLLGTALWTLWARAAGDDGTRSQPSLLQERLKGWFAPAQLLSACVAVALSVWACLLMPTALQRLTGAAAVGALLAAALLACRAPSPHRSALQYAVLALGTLLPVQAGWACLATDTVTPWLYRGGVLLAVLAPMAVLCGLIWRRSAAAADWRDCARRTGTILAVLALAALAAVLAQEVHLYVPAFEVPSVLPAGAFIIAVALAIAVMIGAAVALAVVPGLDPFGLSERGRTAYVYAAEVLLVLLFAHVRLSAPQLFNKEMARYWPFAVLTIAFLGAATGELFRRLGLRVLAEPLERTGVFLPMLPVAVFWVQPPGAYAAVWFLVGLLYVTLSVTRRSMGFALLAAAAANVGLWLVLHQNQLAFVEHPQLWLIPLALSVLGAEYLNRDRLSRTQRNTIRYLALTAIYVSSTAETFLAGLDQDALRPVFLVGLSLVGVFLGMLMRVRAFLFLGAAFLLLGIFAVIRHAAHAAEDRGRIVWLIAGIVLGALIFTLFAIFEKRRNDVLRLLQKLKDWE
jgi:hypothetical protein